MSRAAERARMVREQLARRGIEDLRVLGAMRAVPRHRFVPARLDAFAYDDRPLPIGHGQTISQPFIVARMTEALQIRPGDRVLEIGTGSGYQAAVLAMLGARVVTVERIEALASAAATRLTALGYDEIQVRVADGNDGCPGPEGFEAVLITAATREIPRQPLRQLSLGGRMVLPIGGDDSQALVRITRENGGLREAYLGDCRFVKLIGRHGWEA
jgi:protein-L-isoaspartate(D-aspartate) O-methyltransferase